MISQPVHGADAATVAETPDKPTDRNRPTSFQTQLTVLLVGLVLAAAAVLSGFVYNVLREPLEAHAVSRVSLAADLQRQALLDLLTRQNLRAARLLSAARGNCGTDAGWSRDCLQELLQGYAYAEGVLSARLDYPAGPPLRVGVAEPVPRAPRASEQLAWFSPPGPGSRTYRIVEENDDLRLTLRFGVERIRSVVPDRPDLGEAGEVFLVDKDGAFIMEPSYGGDAAIAQPPDHSVLQRCLAEQDGGLAVTEAGAARWIHGYRYIEEIGGGCAMAHIQQATVFAPIDTLRTRIFWTTAILAGLAALLAALLARRFAQPVRQLTQHVQAFESGRAAEPITSQGSAELRAFADSFTRMAATVRASENRLREAEARHRLVLENALDAFVGTDAAGRVTEWNAQAEALFGWDRRDALGQPVDALLLPTANAVSTAQGLPAFLSSGGEPDGVSPRRETAARHRDGHAIPVELTVTPVTVAGTRYFYAFIRDLTAARRAEAERLRMSRINAAITDNASQALFLMDDRDRCTYMNPAAERLTGYTLAEAQGRPLHGLMHHTHPNGRPYPAGECPIVGALNARHPSQGEDVFVHKSGRFFPVAYTASPIVDGGTVTGAVIEVRDISAEQRRREEQRFLAEVGGLLGESLDLAVTLEKAARLAVPQLADLCSVKLVWEHGISRAALVHRDAAAEARLANLLHDHGDGYPLPFGSEQALRTGQTQWVPDITPAMVADLLRDRPEMTAFVEALAPVSLISVPMQAAGRTFGVITFMHTRHSNRRHDADDVRLAEEFTRRCALASENARLFQQAQEAIQLRDEFLSIASHELKTPLTPLRLQLSLLKRQSAAWARDAAAQGELDRRVDVLQRQNERLIRLVDELLDISRIVRGRLQLQLEPVDLAEVVRDIVSEHREEGAAEPSDSPIRVEADVPVVGRWDRLRVEQVVANLLTNAIKYGAGKPIRLSVAERDGHAVLSVVDQGIGIEPEQQSRIFGRFERAVPARHYGGLGLGLYIVRQVVEAMGGRIDVCSQPGHGSEFTVTLPLAPPGPAAAA